MIVWVLNWSCPYEISHNSTIWADEQSALLQACTEIRAKVNNGTWDIHDEVESEYLKEFNDRMASGLYREAMHTWNHFQDDYNSDEGEWYSVEGLPVLGGKDVDGGCRPPPAVAYKANAAGATCRGQCKQWNEYAYADQSNGTHLCHQCSTFQHIFGVKS